MYELVMCPFRLLLRFKVMVEGEREMLSVVRTDWYVCGKC